MEEDIGNYFNVLPSLTPISNHCNRRMADWGTGDMEIEIGKEGNGAGRGGIWGIWKRGDIETGDGERQDAKGYWRVFKILSSFVTPSNPSSVRDGRRKDGGLGTWGLGKLRMVARAWY